MKIRVLWLPETALMVVIAVGITAIIHNYFGETIGIIAGIVTIIILYASSFFVRMRQ